ncbi:MAG TPA: cysteine-rich CWC family protein [Spongiibacteraceae bacterium]|jgi:hypothetical protein
MSIRTVSNDANYCPACGATNDCEIARGAQYCWCMEQPYELPVPIQTDARCYCRNCLRALPPLQKSPMS